MGEFINTVNGKNVVNDISSIMQKDPLMIALLPRYKLIIFYFCIVLYCLNLANSWLEIATVCSPKEFHGYPGTLDTKTPNLSAAQQRAEFNLCIIVLSRRSAR